MGRQANTTPECVAWFSRLCYNFVFKSMSLSERLFLYDVMGSSLKVSFCNVCLNALVEMSESVYNKVLHCACLFADAFKVALILFVRLKCFLIHSFLGRVDVSLRRHISPSYHNWHYSQRYFAVPVYFHLESETWFVSIFNFKWSVYVIGHCSIARHQILGYDGKLTFMNREWLLSALTAQNYICKLFYNLRWT